jgi:hypothetical protein
VYQFADAQRDLIYYEDVDFVNRGLATNVDAGDYLKPVYNTTPVSEAGSLTFSIPLKDDVSASPVTPQGMKLDWNGDGNFTVEYSLNGGTSWTTAVNNAIQASTSGMATTISPLIRVSFPSGRAPGLDVLRQLYVTIYATANVRAVNSVERLAVPTGIPTTSREWREPIEQDTASGGIITNGNTWTLNQSTDTDPTQVGSIEFIVEWSGTGLTSIYVFDSRSVTPSNASFLWLNASGQVAFSGLSALYINGVATTSGTFVPVAGRQYHIVVVYTATHNAKIALGPVNATSKLNIGLMTIYEAQLTASQAATLASLYWNRPVLAIDDTQAITVAETAPAAKVYTKDWAITGAG